MKTPQLGKPLRFRRPCCVGIIECGDPLLHLALHRSEALLDRLGNKSTEPVHVFSFLSCPNFASYRGGFTD